MLRSHHDNSSFAHLVQMLPPVDVEQGPWIAGGCARKLYDKSDWTKGDVDVFFVNDAQRLAWLAEFDKTWNYTGLRTINQQISDSPPGLTSIFEICLEEATPKQMPKARLFMETGNAITFELWYKMPGLQDPAHIKLQVIKARYADSLQELWQQFDFDVCCFAADAHEVFYTHAAKQNADSKMLSVNPEAANKNLPLRTIKYVAQGFHIPDELFLDTWNRICEGDCEWEQNY